MAGARIEITIDDKQVQASLQRAVEALSTDGLKPLLGELGEYLLGTTRDRAAREVSPSGAKWRALEPAYARRKHKQRPGRTILKFDLHMLGDQLSWQVNGDTLLVGTNAVYGAIHQFGGTIKRGAHETRMPARPFLGLSDSDVEGIHARTLDFIRSAVGAK